MGMALFVFIFVEKNIFFRNLPFGRNRYMADTLPDTQIDTQQDTMIDADEIDIDEVEIEDIEGSSYGMRQDGVCYGMK